MAEKFKILWFSEMFALQMRVVSIWSLELQRVILCQFQISCNSFYILRKTTLAKPSKKLHTSPSGVILIQCLALYYKISFFPTSTRQNPTKSVTWRRPHPRSFLWNCELFVFGGNPRNILMIAAALEGFVLSGCLLPVAFHSPIKMNNCDMGNYLKTRKMRKTEIL